MKLIYIVSFTEGFPRNMLLSFPKADEQLGSYIGTNCPQVAMQTATGKMRKTLAANMQQIFRIIQSIPSKKAEPFKLWQNLRQFKPKVEYNNSKTNQVST